MGQLGMVEEAGPRAATTQRSRVGPGPAKVGLRATATLLQKGDIVGRYTVQNLSAGGALLTGAKDVIKASPCRLLLELPSGESLTVGAHVRRRAVAGDVVALAVGFRHLSPQSEDRIQDAVLQLLDESYRRRHPAVLVVDASEAVRLSVASQLHALGCCVVPCEAPLSAMRVLEDPNEHVTAIVVRDAPGASPGPELLDWVAETYDRVRPILLVEDRSSDPSVGHLGVQRCLPEHLSAVLS